MINKTTLSDSEWKLMKSLWANSPQTIMELTASLKEETGWSKNTVITMLSRLEKKKAVSYKAGDRAKHYYPKISYEEAATTETESFISKVYNGSVGMMLSAIVGSEELTKDDVSDLYEILHKAEDEEKKKSNYSRKF